MARIFVRVDENILYNEPVNASNAGRLIFDYKMIPNDYIYFVEQAYLKGLIAGIDNKGTFAGSKTGTRAEASTMIVRLIDEFYRVDIDALPKKSEYVAEIKEVSYSWEYPYGWISWKWSLRIPVEAVNIYRSIDRRYIYDYSFYVTHEGDDEYMNKLANVFVETAKREGLSEWEMIELAAAFVQDYYYIETTAPGWGIGDLPEEMNGATITISPVY